ncbi:MAG: type II secretion system protein GspJ [Candidatus Omnitrophota bacterium]
MFYIKKKNKTAKGQGLTFMELIIVSALVGLVALAIYGLLSTGLRIWERIQKPLPSEDINIFLDKFQSDLRNCFHFKGIDFSGAQESLVFATLVQSRRLKTETVGQALYSYDANNKALTRELGDFSDVYSGDEGSLKQALEKVESLRFQYYTFDELTKKYVWLEEWLTPQVLPLAVRMELVIGGVDGGVFTKTVSLSVANF